MSGLDDTSRQAAQPPIVVKKYANRRLYDTESSAYITLDDLASMVRGGRDFVVYDARTGDDITRPVLTQIIMEEETRGRSILPTSFLRQLIGFYGDPLQGMVPAFLERMMEQFAARQERPDLQGAIDDLVAPPLKEAARENAALIERAARVFSPLVAVRKAQEAERALRPSRDDLQAEITRLRLEVERLRAGDTGRPRQATGSST